jgi:hypothetical protein
LGKCSARPDQLCPRLFKIVGVLFAHDSPLAVRSMRATAVRGVDGRSRRSNQDC